MDKIKMLLVGIIICIFLGSLLFTVTSESLPQDSNTISKNANNNNSSKLDSNMVTTSMTYPDFNFTISGHVRNEFQFALPSVTINRVISSSQGILDSRSVITDSNGFYSVNDVVEAGYTVTVNVTASRTGYQQYTDSESFSSPTSSSMPVSLDIQLNRVTSNEFLYEGYVKDFNTRNPIVGATVKIIESNSADKQTVFAITTTDSNGYFYLYNSTPRLMSLFYNIDIQAPYYVTYNNGLPSYNASQQPDYFYKVFNLGSANINGHSARIFQGYVYGTTPDNFINYLPSATIIVRDTNNSNLLVNTTPDYNGFFYVPMSILSSQINDYYQLEISYPGYETYNLTVTGSGISNNLDIALQELPFTNNSTSNDTSLLNPANEKNNNGILDALMAQLKVAAYNFIVQAINNSWPIGKNIPLSENFTASLPAIGQAGFGIHLNLERSGPFQVNISSIPENGVDDSGTFINVPLAFLPTDPSFILSMGYVILINIPNLDLSQTALSVTYISIGGDVNKTIEFNLASLAYSMGNIDQQAFDQLDTIAQEFTGKSLYNLTSTFDLSFDVGIDVGLKLSINGNLTGSSQGISLTLNEISLLTFIHITADAQEQFSGSLDFFNTNDFSFIHAGASLTAALSFDAMLYLTNLTYDYNTDTLYSKGLDLQLALAFSAKFEWEVNILGVKLKGSYESPDLSASWDSGWIYSSTSQLSPNDEVPQLSSPIAPTISISPSYIVAMSTQPTITVRSTDPQNKNLTYHIDWGWTSNLDGGYRVVSDSPSIASGTPYTTTEGLTFPSIGYYTITVTVTDVFGQSSSSTQTIFAHQFLVPPVPNTPSGPTTDTISQIYSYTFSDSCTTSGESLNYKINWGDGSYTTVNSIACGHSATVSHSYSALGNVSLSAEVDTSDGVWSGWSSSLKVDVVGPPGTPTITNLPSHIVATSTNPSITVTSIDPQSSHLTYHIDWGWTSNIDGGWRVVSDSVSLKSGSPYTTNAPFPFPSVGYYTITVTVTNTYELISRTSTTIFAYRYPIPPTPNQPSGSTSDNQGQSYTYYFSDSCTTSGEYLNYHINWGDGSYTTVNSCACDYSTFASLSYSSSGYKYISAQVDTSDGVWSGWSSSLAVNVPSSGGGGCGGCFIIIGPNTNLNSRSGSEYKTIGNIMTNKGSLGNIHENTLKVTSTSSPSTINTQIQTTSNQVQLQNTQQDGIYNALKIVETFVQIELLFLDTIIL